MKLNNRILLEEWFKICRISDDKFKNICSSIDKLDKEDWRRINTKRITSEKLWSNTQ